MGAADVFQVERVEVRVALAQAFDVRGAGMRQVEPGDVAVSDDACGHGGDLTTVARKSRLGSHKITSQ